jgi:hypothetical protein
MNTELVYEVRVKTKKGRFNSFHFKSNNIDHAKRRARKKGRILNIKEVKKEKLIGSIESMNLKELITPIVPVKPMIEENMTIEDFFRNERVNKNGGLNGKQSRHYDNKQRRIDETGRKYQD